MGKYTHLRHKLTPFEKSAEAQGMAAWFAKVGRYKLEFLGTDEGANANPALLAYAFAERDKRKKVLEEMISQLNVELEAISQLGVEALEADAAQKIDLAGGGYVSIKDTPYYSVEDRAKAFAWIKKNRMASLLTLAYQTMTGLNNERLLNGKPLIPGTRVFMKTKLTVRGVNSNGDGEES